MAGTTSSLKGPLAWAGMWLATASLAVVAAAGITAFVPHWHTARVYLEQLALWQTWISIAACLSLLMLSKRKHAETEEPWSQGALLIYVLAGLLSAILLNYGVFPRWLVQPASLALVVQVLALVLVHWCMAWRTLRSLLLFRRQR